MGQGITRIQIDDLVFPEPVSGGMNPFVIMSLAYKYRATNEDAEPIIVNYDCDKHYRIADGRHRVVAAMVAGRKEILAEIA